MGKIQRRVYRRDNQEQHIHALPSGQFTDGQILKPSKDAWPWHTHLYTCDGVTMETSQAQEGVDHVHETLLGETSGPLKPRKDAQEPLAPVATIQKRQGGHVIVSETGFVLGQYASLGEAKRQLTAMEASRSKRAG